MSYYDQGTSGYISVEVDRQEYLFRPQKRGPSPGSPPSEEQCRAIALGKMSLSDIRPRFIPEPPPTPIPFRYNPLHDLDSLWWIAVYFVFKSQVIDTSKDDVEAQPLPVSAVQRAYGERLFYDQGQRYLITTVGSPFEKYLEVVHPVLRPLAETLYDMRVQLILAYRKAEENPLSTDLVPGIHDYFMRSLDSMSADDFSHIRLRPFPLVDWNGRPIELEDSVKPATTPIAVAGTKRSASELAHDNEDLAAPVGGPSKLRKTARTRTERTKPTSRTRPYLPRKAKYAT